MSITPEEFLKGGQATIVTSDRFTRAGGIRKVTPQQEQEPEKKGFLSRIGERIDERFQTVKKAASRDQTPFEGVFQLAGQGLGLIGDVGFEAARSGVGALPEFVKDPFREVGDDIAKSKGGQAGFQALASGLEVWEDFARHNPRAAANVVATANYVSFLPVGKATQVVTKPIITGGKTGALAVSKKTLGATSMVPKVVGGTVRTTGKVLRRGTEAVETSADKARRVSKLPPAQANAVRSGLDENVVNFVSSSTKEDAGAFKRMFDVAKQRMDDIRVKAQPKEVVGQTILKRADFLINKKNEVGKSLGDIVNKMPDRAIDITQEYDQFIRDLKSFGIEVTATGRVRSTRLPKSDIKIIQDMVDSIRPNKHGSVLRSPKFLDSNRKRVFDTLDLAKARQEAFSESVDIIAENYRTTLMGAISNVNPQYRMLSREYAEIMGPLREFVRLTQFKGKLDDITMKDLRVAEVAQRVLGNASDRPNSVIEALENTAIEFGFKSNERVFDQIIFSDLLEDFFGTFQRRSLRGQVGRAGADVARGFDLGKVQRAVTGLLSPTDQEQIRALEALLNSLQKPTKGFKAAGPAKSAIKLKVSSISKELDPLVQEARKFNTAEEFVKNQPVVYHGSPVPLRRFSDKKGGVFFTDNFADASGFAGTPDNVYEGFLNFKKPLVVDAKGRKWDNLNTKWGKSTQEVVSNAEKEGFDGVTFKNIVDNVADTEGVGGQSTIHFAFKPSKSFINESELTDIFNKAKGVTKE